MPKLQGWLLGNDVFGELRSCPFKKRLFRRASILLIQTKWLLWNYFKKKLWWSFYCLWLSYSNHLLSMWYWCESDESSAAQPRCHRAYLFPFGGVERITTNYLKTLRGSKRTLRNHLSTLIETGRSHISTLIETGRIITNHRRTVKRALGMQI